MNGRPIKPITENNSVFSEIIEKGGFYVDKTGYIKLLLDSGSKFFFLSRPRRFGKTLLVDTIETIFSGRRELFEGLAISSGWTFDKHPVIRLNMSGLSGTSYALFKKSFAFYMKTVARQCSLSADEMDADLPESYLTSLIDQLYYPDKKQVVVLVDEYDYPLTSLAIPSDDMVKVRNYLASFYQVLKTQEAKVRFVFITGVLRFSNVSIFSKLNNLVDISQDSSMAAVCGYDEEEFRQHFMPHVDAYLETRKDIERGPFLEKIRSYYDGYRFSPASTVRVYNPVSLARLANTGFVFSNYWAKTGSMTLVKRIVQENAESLLVPQITVSNMDTTIFEVEEFSKNGIPPAHVHAYLLQTGYLTIADMEKDGMLSLRYPNEEVASLVKAYILQAKWYEKATAEFVIEIRSCLLAGDTRTFVDKYSQLYASIPHQANRTVDEGTFQSILLSTLIVMGFDAVGEVSSSGGDSDIVVKLENGSIYIFELKVDKTAQQCLDQIIAKGYARQYSQRPIHLVGLSFTKKTRTLDDYKEMVID